MTDPRQLHLFYRTAGAATPAVQTSLFDAYPTLYPRASRLRDWQREARKAMVEIRSGLQIDPEMIGLRWANALKGRYPGPHQAKRIATDLKTDPRTVQAWLAGQAPQIKALYRAAMIHGVALVLEVLAPDSRLERDARIFSDLVDLERRLERLRGEVETLRKVPP